MPVKAADKNYDAPALEREVQSQWKAEGTRAAVRKARAGAERFRFIDGPPYTSGHIHLGTAWNKTLKDLVLRYKTMRGFLVRDQPGYDMHGLPIEVRVEKELGITSKQEIEDLGVDRFVDKCRSFALEFLATMNEEFAQLGVWMDWEHPYRTIDDTYIEAAWWTIKRGHEKELLYQDNRVLSWCPRCQTALAEAEVEYWDEEDPSIMVAFPLADEPDTSLVIWTTTPWTIPANLAIAVNPTFQYAKVWVKRGDKESHIIVEENLVDKVVAAGRYDAHAVVEHIRGVDLDETRYSHPLAGMVPYHQEPPSDRCHTVVLGDHVTAEETGLVHTAPGHGADDFEVGRKHGIPAFSVIGPDGAMNDDAGEFAGKAVTEANEAIMDALDAAGALVSRELVSHRYGHCWRCKTPILFRATDQWFFGVSHVRDRMLEEIARIRWTPEWAGASRQRDWVENARDWCISRQRYWGIPLPVWHCEATGDTVVIGSKAELLDRSGLDELPDLHRPHVDEVTFTDDDGNEYRRVEDVLDVWFDSACATWGSLGYPADEDAFDDWWPCDFIVEGLDQTRGWFYSQLAAGVVAHDQVPYEEVVMHGFVHDAEGRPMSKSLGNIIRPAEIIETFGADAMRLAFLSASAPWEDVSFGPDSARSASRTLNILWNVHVFATQYMALDGFEPRGGVPEPSRPDDRWVLSRLASTVERATEALEAHHYHRAARAIEDYVLEDLSRWYVRLSRERAWKGADDDKAALYETLHAVLSVLARALAPFTPHVTERIWTDLGHDGTVHGQDWPSADELGGPDHELENHMDVVRDVVDAAARARERAGLGLRWPVARVLVSGAHFVEQAVERLTDVLASQTNARSVEFVGADWEELDITARPSPGAIGPIYKAQAQAVIDAVKDADARALKSGLDVDGVASVTANGRSFDIKPGMVEFGTTVPDTISGEPFDGGAVYVDTELTDELRSEGLARELLRRIQELRKQADLDLEAQAGVAISAPEGLRGAVEGHVGMLEEEGRVTIEWVDDAPEGEFVFEDEIEGDEVVVVLR